MDVFFVDWECSKCKTIGSVGYQEGVGSSAVVDQILVQHGEARPSCKAGGSDIKILQVQEAFIDVEQE